MPSAGAAGGTFASPTSASTLFVPAALTAGVSEVGVRSDADLSCGSTNQTVEGVTYSNLTSYTPPSLSNLSVDPSATSAPGVVHLHGLVSGGRAPYLLGIDWDDGSFTNLTLPAEGPFVAVHTFEAGTFLPRLGLYDSDRIDVREALPEPVDVSNGTALAINASLPLAEVGVPAQFYGEALRPVAHFGQVIACSTDPIVLPPDYVTNVTCTPTVPGTLPVTFKVGAPVPSLVTQKTLEEPVAPALALTVRPISLWLDDGTPSFLRVTILGGVPPFRVIGRWPGSALTSPTDAPSDGSFLVGWTPSLAGGAALSGSVTDSLGVSANASPVKVLVAAAPTIDVRANAEVNVSKTSIQVETDVSGGSAPLYWGLEPDPLPVSGPPPVGVANLGNWEWSGTYVGEGMGSFEIQVEDAAGAIVNGTIAVPLPAGLTLNVSELGPTSTGPPGINLTLWTSGGVLPFSIWINSSGSTLWNGSQPTPGPYNVFVPLGVGGTDELEVTGEDARGVRVFSNLSVPVPLPVVSHPGAISESESNTGPWLVGIALLVVAGGMGVARWRRRERRAEPPPDPAALLERLLRPADGADRLTIELMAEEEGVPLEMVRETLDRLIQEGRVRAGSDPDGGEVLAWATD